MLERHLVTSHALYAEQAAQLLGISSEVTPGRVGYRRDVDPNDAYYPKFWGAFSDPDRPSVESHVVMLFDTDEEGYGEIIVLATQLQHIAEEEGVRNESFESWT